MIHQAMGGAQGQAEDIKVEATQILQIHENVVGMTGQPPETIRKDLMRDNFFSAAEAKEYGLIDQVIQLSDATDLPGRTAATEEPAAGEAPKSDDAPPSGGPAEAAKSSDEDP